MYIQSQHVNSPHGPRQVKFPWEFTKEKAVDNLTGPTCKGKELGEDVHLATTTDQHVLHQTAGWYIRTHLRCSGKLSKNMAGDGTLRKAKYYRRCLQGNAALCWHKEEVQSVSSIRAGFGMLEPCDGKLSSTVLRREGSHKAPALSGTNASYGAITWV